MPAAPYLVAPTPATAARRGTHTGVCRFLNGRLGDTFAAVVLAISTTFSRCAIRAGSPAERLACSSCGRCGDSPRVAELAIPTSLSSERLGNAPWVHRRISGMSSDRVLDSWKAIAAYFGKSVRTVQNWEKRLGLPVRRLGGTRVQAFVGELEAWREENLSSPSTSRRLPGQRLLPRGWVPIFCVVLAAFAAFLVFAVPRRERPAEIAAYGLVLHVDGDTTHVRAIPQDAEWTVPTRSLPIRKTLAMLKADERIRRLERPLLVYDHQDLGPLLVSVEKLDAPGSSDVVRAFTESGQTAWTLSVGRSIRVGNRVFDRYRAAVIDFVKARDTEYLLVLAWHFKFYPNQFLLIDPLDGRIVDEFWHPGRPSHIEIVDLNRDGIDEVVFGAINNPEQGDGHAAVGVLAVPFSAAGQTTRDLLGDLSAARPLHYRLLARPDVWKHVGKPPVVSRLDIRSKTRHISVSAGFGALQINYDFDFSLEPQIVVISDDIRRAHFELRREGLLDHELGPAELEVWKRSDAFDYVPDGNSQSVCDRLNWN